MHEYKVSIFRRKGTSIYYMQYRDPHTGLKVPRTTGKDKKRDAERAAADWERELREGKDKRFGRIGWEEFRTRYEDEVLPGLASRTWGKVSSVLNSLEKHISPRRLGDLTSERLTTFQKALREAGRSENTIKGHLAHVRAALAWAVDMSLLPAVPKMPKTPRAKQTRVMKGRPVTGEEFERMLAKVESGLMTANEPDRKDGKQRKRRSDKARGQRLVRRREAVAKAVASWEYLLRGLWWSGLRLGEALELHWTDETKPRVDMTCRHAMLRMPAESEKGNKDRLLPLAPEFATFLEAIPAEKRVGYVFNPKAVRADKVGERIGEQQVSRMLGQIGKAAVVKVSDTGKVKFASAHDLRRSFGSRWASRVMPQVLMELMRHESIDTTLRYYVGRNAQATAAILWEALGKQAVGVNLGVTPDIQQETANPASA